MIDTGPDDSSITPNHWDRWPMLALERIRLPYPWIIVLMALLGIISVALDTAFRYRLNGVWPARDVAVGVTSVVVSVYILAYVRLIKRTSGRALARLRRSVLIADAEYDSYVHRFLHARGHVEIILLGLAVVLLIVFLVLPPNQLRGLPRQYPIEIVGLVVIALYWTLLFYLLLSLVYISIRNARALGGLARQPLEVNVFDPDGLLPFGNLGLVQSLAYIGLFIIPLIIIGPPSREGGGWLVIGLSLVSLLALFVPLWGVHQQIVRARDRVLANLSNEFLEIQQSLLRIETRDTEALRALSQRTDALLQLRKQIMASPSWPFRNSGSVARAAIATASPVIFFVLNHAVQTYFFPLFGLK
jgi:hypothetical protein